MENVAPNREIGVFTFHIQCGKRMTTVIDPCGYDTPLKEFFANDGNDGKLFFAGKRLDLNLCAADYNLPDEVTLRFVPNAYNLRPYKSVNYR